MPFGSNFRSPVTLGEDLVLTGHSQGPLGAELVSRHVALEQGTALVAGPATLHPTWTTFPALPVEGFQEAHALHRASPAELRERLQAERRGRPFLLFRDGDDGQRIVDLADVPDRVTIGRSPDNQIALPWDLEVSRVHAGLERLGTEWTLVDDGRSRNGSFVDGRRVHGRTRLRDGDVLSVGRTAIVFRNPTGNESLSTAISARTPHPRVTAAQQRVLTALCRPYATAPYATPASNHEIAHELVLGIETVKSHLKALFDAFAVGTLPQHEKRAALARMALEQGVVSLRDLLPGGDDTARPETR